ncbi:uncharacterized protein BJ171DRAFT_491378 [Polychytrium aggregatum]|uniref:uncharacterized protein n=1 Tax=Polychytrium aggregatum TaxID=110093 RepID=UPI0022FEA21C|nr:uncharacterized protein BJ171DRAFT_491378 [Polychytrium aggregatum]KAI9207760.1 hypothetical protein BJ171DRAFT_491378 [Polychytrium aggregatum]
MRPSFISLLPAICTSRTMSTARYTYYHHPTCSKAAGCSSYLQKTIPGRFVLINYVETPVDRQTLRAVLSQMDIDDLRLAIRTENLAPEAKLQVENATLDSVDAFLALLDEDPARLQRPIVVDHELKKAVVGRPLDRIVSLIEGHK